MRSTLVVLLLVTISLLLGVEAARNAGLSTSISESDLNEIKNVVLANKDWSSNLNTAYYLTSTLANLEKSQQAEVATLAKNTLKSKDKSLEAIFQAASIAETLKLNDVTVDKSVVDAIKKAIDAGESLTDLYYAGSAALSLRALKLAKEVTDDDLSKIVSAVADFAEEDGTFRSSASDKEGSLYNSGLALQVIARLVKDTKLPEEEKERVDEVVDKVESIISLANEEQNQLEFPGDDSANSLATTSAVFVGLNALAAATKKPLPEVSATQVAQIGQYLVNQKKVGDIKDAFHLLNGVRTLTNNVIAIPLAVSLERASIVGTAKGSEGQVRVKVTDALDKPITAAKVVLIKAQPASGKDTHVLLSNQELSLSDDKKTFALNFLAAKPEQGFYNLEFRVVPTDAKTYTTVDSATRSVKVVGSISITDLEIAIADSKEALNKHSEGGLYKAADQSKKIDDVIRIDHLQFVNVKFRVRGAGGSNKPVLVQQAFVKLVHKSGHEAIFVAQPNENKIYSVVIDVDEASKSQFKSQSGDYKLEIVAGDAFIQNPVHWIAAPNVKLTLANAATSSKNALGPLPEIKHAFRKPEPRPPVAVSNVATLIVLSPILFLLIGFIAVGANISQFPFTGMDFIYAVGFLASIGATLGLMGLYWLKLNLVQTLGYLAVLAVPNVFFGQRALSRLAKRKDKTEKSD